MRKIINILVILGMILVFFVPNVSAQGQAPYVIKSTKPISAELRDDLDAWLAVAPPSDAPYYVVTYTHAVEDGTAVSLAGVTLDDPEDDFSLSDGERVRWVGSVTVSPEGVVVPFQAAANAKVAWFDLSYAAGGGSYVSFPFQAGTAAIYGPRAVHGDGDYGTSGMLAVDLVSGDDLGSGAAPPYVYASDDGVIDYVCDDGVTVAVRTYNATSGDYFLYAHMLDNANLEIDHSFSRGELIGNLKYGSFNPPDPDCGWAEQQEDHYHVHWMFVPANGAFQAEGCVLSVSTKKWTCGTEVIGTGGWIHGGGGTGVGNGSGTGLDNVGGTAGGTADPSFWDYIIVGVAYIVDPLWKLAPEHSGFQFVYTISNTVSLVLRLARVFIYGNINLGPFLAALVVVIGFRLILGIFWAVAFLFKAWKSLVPVFGA